MPPPDVVLPARLAAWLPPGWRYSPAPARDQGWRAVARCAADDVNPEAFHPPAFDERGEDRTGEAVEVCRACPVREACLNFALTVGDDLGVLGGIPPGPRASLRRSLDVGPHRGLLPHEKRTHGTPWAYNFHRRLGEDPCDACREAKRLYGVEERRRRAEAGRASASVVRRAREALAGGRLTLDQGEGTAVYRDSFGRECRLTRDADRWRCPCDTDAAACTHVVAVQLALGEPV